MKKSFVLLLTLAILFTGTAIYAQGELLKEKDQVHYTETVVYGDRSVVDGVVFEADTSYEYHLFWNTKYQIGDTPKEETQYQFYEIAHFENSYNSSGSLYFTPNLRDIESDPTIFLADKECDGLMGAYQELYQNTEPGAQNTAVVYMKEYSDFYTFDIELHLPTVDGVMGNPYYEFGYLREKELKEELANYEKNGGENKERIKEYKSYLYLLDTLQEYFKIPVLEKEVLSIGISVDENGLVDGWSESDVQGGMSTGNMDFPPVPNVEGADHYEFNMNATFVDGECYFTFNPYTANGNLVDLSYIPDGFGIYRFTYDAKATRVDIDSLEMVYPIDLSRRIHEIRSDASGKNLLLFSEDNEQVYMDIIDRETMTLVDAFALGSREISYDKWTYDDFFVVSGEKLEVYELGENGRYTKALSVSVDAIKEKIDTNRYDRELLQWNAVFDWNGETLLFADRMIFMDAEGWSSVYTCDLYVAAVDETGLVYFGEYVSSLNASVMFNPDKLNPIQIRWE